ncbi:hypothetical protein Q9L58_010399 [Maublancomyces gigas]|uniref:non-specific serine/threonine protein kinase n=1 Tax=Discina gigas TaxID=1032678 RepID=A0ABR3G4M8_9PEZI
MNCGLGYFTAVEGSGVINTASISIRKHSYAIMTPEELGFDTTLEFDSYSFRMQCEDGKDRVFQIRSEVFFHRKAIASRGTTCWSVVERGNKAQYILKDSWRSVNHGSEITLLRKAMERGVQGIAEIIAFEEVQFDGKLDDVRGNIMKGLRVGKPMRLKLLPASLDVTESTDSTLSEAAPPTPENSPHPPDRVSPVGSASLSRTRSGAVPRVSSSGSLNRQGPALFDSPNPPRVSSQKRKSSSIHEPRPKGFQNTPQPPLPPPEFDRVHTRILMRQGRELTTFSGTSELLWGFHDAIQGHRSLVESDILHRDISIDNIMLSDPADRSDGKRGFIIDLDLAVQISSTQPSSAPHRTGIMEFNAIGVLRGERHTFRHDLESFFYVFLWICVTDPRSEWRWTPLAQWSTGGVLGVADVKEKHMRRGVYAGYEVVEGWFAEWAVELRGVAEQWREALFRLKPNGALTLETPEDRSGMYDEILGALKAAAVKMGGGCTRRGVDRVIGFF